MDDAVFLMKIIGTGNTLQPPVNFVNLISKGDFAESMGAGSYIKDLNVVYTKANEAIKRANS